MPSATRNVPFYHVFRSAAKRREMAGAFHFWGNIRGHFHRSTLSLRPRSGQGRLERSGSCIKARPEHGRRGCTLHADPLQTRTLRYAPLLRVLAGLSLARTCPKPTPELKCTREGNKALRQLKVRCTCHSRHSGRVRQVGPPLPLNEISSPW
jgi:hypothetical protein